MNKIVNPHDRFFRTALSDSRVALEFFGYHLPAFIKEHIDWNSLRLCPTSYIDKSLKLSASDVVYQVTIAEQDAYLYLLAEHQSQPDKLMPFRIWQYILAIQAEHFKKTKTESLPLVYPLVFYHGKAAYNYSTDIKDLIAAPANLVERVLFKPFQLVDTHQLPDDELKQLHWAGVMEFMMKHIFARDFVPYFKQMFGILRDLEKMGGTDYIVSILNYAIIAAETGDHEQFVEMLKTELPATVEEKFMTVEQWLIEKGKMQGKMQGKMEGKMEGKIEGIRQEKELVATRLLEKGSSLQFVAEITGLSLDEVQRLLPETTEKQ